MADSSQYVGFMLGSERYGVDIMSVEEIIRFQEITPVPKSPDFVEGIINLRGIVIPVIDLRKRLNLPAETSGSLRIIITRVAARRLGLMVDSVEQVAGIDPERIDDAPGLTPGARKFVTGVARTERGLVILLDIFKIFTSEEQTLLTTL